MMENLHFGELHSLKAKGQKGEKRMDLKELKQSSQLKAIDLLVKVQGRAYKDVVGRQNELALGLREFYENPTKELDVHNSKLKVREEKRVAKLAAKKNVKKGKSTMEEEKQPEEKPESPEVKNEV